MRKRAKVIADDWMFIDYDKPSHEQKLPLFISRVLAVTKRGRQLITQFDHETYEWDLDDEVPLAPGDYIMAWTQVHYPKEDE